MNVLTPEDTAKALKNIWMYIFCTLIYISLYCPHILFKNLFACSIALHKMEKVRPLSAALHIVYTTSTQHNLS